MPLIAVTQRRLATQRALAYPLSVKNTVLLNHAPIQTVLSIAVQSTPSASPRARTKAFAPFLLGVPPLANRHPMSVSSILSLNSLNVAPRTKNALPADVRRRDCHCPNPALPRPAQSLAKSPMAVTTVATTVARAFLAVPSRVNAPQISGLGDR